MGTLDATDIREWQVLARGLADLGLDPGEFTIEVAAVEEERSPGRVMNAMPRKAIVVKHTDGSTFRHETYVNGPWAGEIVQAIIRDMR